uniref:Thioredoxin domain-containing protein n=1 Tax=viral metagenome TaxID=1070528 RepID=A0A6C0HAV1_9ZZZZ
MKYHRGTEKQKSSKPITIGLVYAEWCGHCQALKPEWEKLKETLSKNKKCNIFEVEDSDVNKDAKLKSVGKKINGGSIQVNGFPTLFKILNGNVEYYNGERTFDALLKWANRTFSYGGKTRKNRRNQVTRKNRV